MERDLKFSEKEKEKLNAIQTGIDFKTNKENYPETTWETLNDDLGKPYATGESFRSAVKAFQRSLRDADGEVKHKYALPYAKGGNEKLLQLKKEKVKLQDERRQYAEYIRNVARQETYGELALECVEIMAKSKPFLKPKTALVNGDRCAISQISDWHLGLDIENGVNKYNLDIAKESVNNLLNSVITYSKFHNVSKVYVVNLQDMISGWIHARIRLESREDVIQQVMLASEMVAEYLQELSKHFLVEYYSSLDNHSRLDPNKNDSMKLENFVIIMNWYIKTRLANNPRVKINQNEFSEDIVIFDVLGHNVIGVHGDKDRPASVVKNLTLLTKKFYQICLTAHLHHFYCEENNDTVVISNGSLVGVDNYSEILRLTSRPTQNLIIVSKENPVECIYPIVVR